MLKFIKLLAILGLSLSAPALAASTGGNSSGVVGDYFYNVKPLTSLTRATNTTPYAASQSVCASVSMACVPFQFQLIRAATNSFRITRVTLLKSGSSTTNAAFILWLYSAPPGLTTPTQVDATGYTGPRSTDLPNYIGNAACATGVATSDTSAGVWYDCTLSNPNDNKVAIGYGLSTNQSGLTSVLTVYGLLSATAAYTPVSGEVFTPYLSGVY